MAIPQPQDPFGGWRQWQEENPDSLLSRVPLPRPGEPRAETVPFSPYSVGAPGIPQAVRRGLGEAKDRISDWMWAGREVPPVMAGMATDPALPEGNIVTDTVRPFQESMFGLRDDIRELAGLNPNLVEEWRRRRLEPEPNLPPPSDIVDRSVQQYWETPGRVPVDPSTSLGGGIRSLGEQLRQRAEYERSFQEYAQAQSDEHFRPRRDAQQGVSPPRPQERTRSMSEFDDAPQPGISFGNIGALGQQMQGMGSPQQPEQQPFEPMTYDLMGRFPPVVDIPVEASAVEWPQFPIQATETMGATTVQSAVQRRSAEAGAELQEDAKRESVITALPSLLADWAKSASPNRIMVINDNEPGGWGPVDKMPDEERHGFYDSVLGQHYSPDAVEWFKDNISLSILDPESEHGGGHWYARDNHVGLFTAQPEAAVHEFAHAWWEHQRDDETRKDLVDSLLTLANDQRAAMEYPAAHRLAGHYVYGTGDWEGMGSQAKTGGHDVLHAGKYWNDHEIFAGLASGVMGDIEALPPYMRQYYEDLFGAPGQGPALVDDVKEWRNLSQGLNTRFWEHGFR